jgi:nitrogen-specific signal transduction histidine kinase/ActR/RegA family two-component response regulator
VEHTTGDGSSRSLTVSLGFVPPDLVVAHVADVSVERRLQERLHQVQKMEVMGRMAAGVAHDFNNMLTVILACADILISGVQSDDPALVDLLEIRGAAERATALTRQLTTFSRQEVVRPGVVDLKRHILEVARMLEKLLGDERALSLVLTDAPCSIEIHPPHLDQVLFNLVANARDATAKGGHVTIETAAVEVDEVNAHAMGDLAPGPYLLLAVTDDGVGMDTTSQARAFEPFYTTKPPGMGTGMGLATVYGIVRQCGGHVAVFGAPGLGTTIRILFPRAATPAPERRATGAGEHRARATGTVLVVEDDESIRKLVQRVLTSAGYRVLTAANAAEARSLCESHKETLDLLLTDVVLPSQSGPELAAELPQIVPGLPVLFMSGYAERAAWATARLEPGMNFIAKPFTVEVLIRMVREILNQAVARPRA